MQNKKEAPDVEQRGRSKNYNFNIRQRQNKSSVLLKKYHQKLCSLPASGGGGCHPALLGVSNLGILAGLSPAQIFNDLRSAVHGTRDVPDREIKKTIERAERDIILRPDVTHTRPSFNRYSAKRRTNKEGLHRLLNMGAGTTEKEITDISPIPISWNNDSATIEVLKNLYVGDEFIFCGRRDEPGILNQNILNVEQWIERFYNTQNRPEFIIPNPLTRRFEPKESGDGKTYRGNRCVSNFRFAVIEFDNLSREDQLAFWYAVQLPVCALIDSGNKSIHGWVKIDEINTLSDWKRDVEQRVFREFLEPLGVDGSCKNAARLSRCPGHYRREKGQWQRVLYLAPEGKAGGGMKALEQLSDQLHPKVFPVGYDEIMKAERSEKDIILKGVFEKADKVEIIGQAKAKKSFFAMQMGICLAYGLPFIGMEPKRAFSVGFYQMEVKEGHSKLRGQGIVKGMQAEPEMKLKNNFALYSYRGNILDAEKIISDVKERGHEIIFLDPLYKFNQGDESYAELKASLQAIDEIATKSESAVVYVHHDPKGYAGERQIQDRGSGSGILGRDCDARITLTPHSAHPENVRVVEFMLRNFEPIIPITIEWQDGSFQLSELLPSKQTSRDRVGDNRRLEDMVGSALEIIQEPLPTGVFKCLLREELALPHKKVDELYNLLLHQKKIQRSRKEPKQGGSMYVGLPQKIEQLEMKWD